MNPLLRPPRCTLTGIDDGASMAWLLDTAARYPFVEFGALLSYSRVGTGRYARFGALDWLAREAGSEKAPRFALHVCGKAVNDFIQDDGAVMSWAYAFPRIQLNLRADRIDVPALRAAIRRHRGQQIITQHNRANEQLLAGLDGVSNRAVLFDQSGGRGIAPESWPPAFKWLPCGYAGGLGPDNIAEQLPRIAAAAAGAVWWIDMEAKLRDERDCFDRRKAEAVLQAVDAWMKTAQPG
jgi:hypothetical protein